VRIPGHTGWILGSYLHDIFQSWHSNFVAVMQLENHTSQPCLTVSDLKILGLFNLDQHKLPPDGSKDAFQVFFLLLDSLYACESFIGCAASALDGSSPRGYSRKYVSSIGSNKSFLLIE
jgi:hypothetical protein